LPWETYPGSGHFLLVDVVVLHPAKVFEDVHALHRFHIGLADAEPDRNLSLLFE
jgi:hypothetical protein